MKNVQPENSQPNDVKENKTLPTNIFSLLNKKKPLLVFIVFLLIIIIAPFVFILKGKQLQQGSKTPAQNTTVSPAVSTKTVNDKKYKEFIKEAIAYVESQRRPDGFYEYVAHYDEQCIEKNGKKECPFSGTRMFETTNTWTALAHFAAYKALGEQSELQKANRDLAKLMDWCSPDPKKCLWVLAQPAIIYQETKDPKIFTFLKDEGTILTQTASSDNAMLAAIEARELALLYKLTGNKQYLEKANLHLNSANKSFVGSSNIYQNTKKEFKRGSCWIALGAIEIESLSTKKYNNIAAFLDNGQIAENMANIDNPVDLQPCIESYVNLYKETNNFAYLQYANKLFPLFINQFFDSKNAKMVYGEGGTRFNALPDNKDYKKMIVLTDSAYTNYLAYLLVQN